MGASSKQPFEIVDFSGGITDNVWSGQTSTAQTIDNFNITPDKKLLTRSGSVVDDLVNPVIPVGNQRIGALINYAFNDQLFVQSGKQVFFRNPSAYQTLLGPSGNNVFTAGTTINQISTSEWNKQLLFCNDAFSNVMVAYKDGSGNYQLRNAGLPALASSPTVAIGGAGTGSYTYGFCYSYVYTVGVNTFEWLSPVVYVEVLNSSDPSTTPNVISGIPVLTNAGNNNFDLANIHVDIYRTTNNGVPLYRIGQVVNGTTTFTDSVGDTAAQNSLQLYTNDDTLDYYPPPPSKFVHVVGEKNIALYAYTQDQDGGHPFRIHQSIPGNPSLVPQITWVEVDQEVTGINSVKGLPIVGCKRNIYRLDGVYTASGQGGLNPTKIDDSAGCISNNSMVEAENWLFWAGHDGFYATDGYQVLKISDHLNFRYRAMIQTMQNTNRIIGKFDEVNRRVYWAMEQNAGTLDNDVIFSLDLRYGVTPNSTFHTYSGNSFRPSAIEMFNGLLYRGDTRGFVFQHSDQVLTDPKVDVSTLPANWNQETIIWNYIGMQFNFGSSFMRKFVSRILLQAANAGNTTIQITAINDQGKKVRPLKPIRWRRNFTWGSDDFVWGNSDCVWNGEGIIEQWRRFPARGLRLSYLQMQISNALGIVADSDDSGIGNINKLTKTVTISGSFPSQSVDYFISFETDNYSRQYQVAQINPALNMITVLDPNNALPMTGAYKWQLQGYQKGEPLNLLGYNLHWDSIDQNQGTFQNGDAGGNA